MEESVEELTMVEQLAEEKSMWEPVEWDVQMEPEV